MTGIPEQPDRRSVDPLVQRIDDSRRRIADLEARELEEERARADRLRAELDAVSFVLGVMRALAPTAFLDALVMAREEPGITVPTWLDRSGSDCLECGHRHTGPALGGICVGCPCDQGATS